VLDPIKLAYNQCRPDDQLKLTANALNGHTDILAVSVSGPTHCYAELAVSSPAVAETTAVTHFTYFPQRDGQNEWYEKYRNGRPAKGDHQSQY